MDALKEKGKGREIRIYIEKGYGEKKFNSGSIVR